MNAATAKRLASFKKQIPAFCAWLSERGAEVLVPTNEWEILRFKANGDVGVIYSNKVGRLNFQGVSESAVNAFFDGSPWRGGQATKRRQQGSIISRSLVKRDGNRCFFCNGVMADDNRSVEHLVAVTHGGPNHMSNFVLAHRGCNADAGHLSAMEKINIHTAAILANAAG